MTGLHPELKIAGFEYQPAIPYQEGVTRRDPSPVILIDGLYHVWYSKNLLSPDGFRASVWHAVSSDGINWEERGEAIGKGRSGSFDACGVFTPSILVAEGRYWMTYTAMPMEWCDARQTTKGAVGLAVAESPHGPWEKVYDKPILRCSDAPTAFDSLRVDDTCFVVREGRYWMYYKGRQWNRPPRETKMGLAIAERPEGPYVKHEGNPVLDSGHEVCVWPHRGGVAALISDVGPQGRTLQYSGDGIRFHRVAGLTRVPHAPGPSRDDAFVDGADCTFQWGVSIGGTGKLGEPKTDRPYIQRWQIMD